MGFVIFVFGMEVSSTRYVSIHKICLVVVKCIGWLVDMESIENKVVEEFGSDHI